MNDNTQPSPKMRIMPPQSQNELLARCNVLAGTTLGQVAVELGVAVPNDLKRHKGWVGNLLEIALGADAGNKAEPDFVGIGVEMKTLPLNAQSQPKESTYICTVSLQQTGEMEWQDSWVRRKLARVLWVPVEADNAIPLAERYIGQALLWQPTIEQDLALKKDWQELMDRVVLGEQAEITAKEGEFLQIRPKAAHSRVLAAGVSEDGLIEKINPKGFYLRTIFTKQLLDQG